MVFKHKLQATTSKSMAVTCTW